MLTQLPVHESTLMLWLKSKLSVLRHKMECLAVYCFSVSYTQLLYGHQCWITRWMSPFTFCQIITQFLSFCLVLETKDFSSQAAAAPERIMLSVMFLQCICCCRQWRGTVRACCSESSRIHCVDITHRMSANFWTAPRPVCHHLYVIQHDAIVWDNAKSCCSRLPGMMPQLSLRDFPCCSEAFSSSPTTHG